MALVGRYNSLENPIGIETIVRTDTYSEVYCYNSLENPIGIETHPLRRPAFKYGGYNSLENPIGIETNCSRDGRGVKDDVTTH